MDSPENRVTVFRIPIFISILIGLLLSVWGYVWLAFVDPLPINPQIKYALLCFFIATFLAQLLRFFYFRRKHAPFSLILFTYYFMGLFVHLFFAGLTKNFLLLLPPLSLYEIPITYMFFCLAFLLNAWGIFTALSGPKVITVNIAAPQAKPLRIIQISDLHVGPIINRRYVERVVEKCNATKPDIVVLTGDIGDGEPSAHTQDWAPLARLTAPLGVYYVTGNHEYYWGAQEWISAMRSVGIKPLLHEGVALPGKNIWLGGVPDIGAGHFIQEHTSDPQRALPPPTDENMYKILLAHQPKSCFAAERAGFDLMLSGHTHAGQFFPFNLVVGLFNPFSQGLNQQGKMQVYVNAGTGFWGPPLRLWVPSEISLLQLGPF